MKSLPTLLIILALACSAHAALSPNLVTGGDFENTAYLKTTPSPDGVLTHRFSQQHDVGMWLAKWGPPSQGGYAGFGLYDDPRDLNETGGDTQTTGDLGCVNRSLDPLNPSNHILEVDMFRPRWGQWIAAPANQTTGTIEFSFDLLVSQIDSELNQGHIWLMGLNQLPANDVSYCSDDDGALAPLGGDSLELNGTAAGDVIFDHWFGQWQAQSDPDFLDQWHHIAFSADLTQTYPYYAIIAYTAPYSEAHPYFWLYGGKITDSFAHGADNFDLRLTLESTNPYAQYYCDFNLDGLVNVQDINPFVKALTNPELYLVELQVLMLTQAGIPLDQLDQLLMAIDPSQDGYVDPWPINVQDINPFVEALQGLVSAGDLAVIPEPATLSLLTLGALLLPRKRR